MAEEQRDFDKLWDYGNPAETEKKFRKVWEDKKAGADPGYLAELQTQIARTHSLRGKYDEAHKILDGVEKALRPEDLVPRLRYLLERGRTFNSSGQKDKAKPFFMEAWDQGREIGAEAHAVDAGHMVAVVGDAKWKLQWELKTIEYARECKSKLARGWLGSLYNNLGWSYHSMERYEEALDAFHAALKVREEQKKGVGTAKWCVARCLRSLGRVDEALAIQEKLLKGVEGRNEDGYTYEEMAECLAALGRADEARPYFKKAFEHLSKISWLAESEPKRIERLKKLGEP